MKMHLSRPQMLAAWRLHRLLEPIRDDASVTRSDGLDLDALLAPEMDAWYTDLLLNGPPHLLVSHDIAGSVSVHPCAGNGMAVTLPPETVRVLSVRISSWQTPARILPPASVPYLCGGNPYLHPLPQSPVAVRIGDELRLYPAVEGATVTELKCVLHTEGEYEFMQEALASVAPLDSGVITSLFN